MKVLVDTSVWSLALRRNRKGEHPETEALNNLITEGRATLIGAIRQELLSGIKDKKQFKRLAQHLAAFPDLALNEQSYALAASFYNQCRAKGIQGSNTDFLICAAAMEHDIPIFTTDKDFKRYSKHLPIALFTPEA